ncbi:RHS repeat domain-containing protein, partial [Parachlamydia acanthamoebae]|uniref:RHS repeat domain-containing protein n=1 Tax=Parachlamydia acanthamoebae TaxID=83552 RepID=UPI0024E1DBA5
IGNIRFNYTYDDLSRRLSKVKSLWDPLTDNWVTQDTQYFLYQGDNEVGVCDAEQHLMECRPLGHGRGAEIGAAVAFEIQEKVYIPLTNFTGHVQVLLNSKGEPVDIYRYTAFGEETIFDPSEDAKDPTTSWRFCSKRTDPETDLIYFGRRYYDPQIARWITADPLGYEAGPNLYAYVNNSPLMNLDLYGLFIYLGNGDYGPNDFENGFMHGYTHAEGQIGPNGEIYPYDLRSIEYKNPIIGALGEIFGELAECISEGLDVMGAAAALSVFWRNANILKKGWRVLQAATASQSAAKTIVVAKEASILAKEVSVLGKEASVLAKEASLLTKETSIIAKEASASVKEFDLITRKDVIHVTPHGVAIPPQSKYQIPSHYVENKKRVGSYDEHSDLGIYIEKLRIDQATPPGVKGPNFSHYHLNNKGTHHSPRPGASDPGFGVLKNDLVVK